MSKLSGIKDLDKEIFGKLDDSELLKACSINKYTWNVICDDAFLRRRLLSKYPEIEKYKEEGENWKRFFSRTSHYITNLKKKFNYIYTFGNLQYKLLIKYGSLLCSKNLIPRINPDAPPGSLLIKSAEKGELALVDLCLKNNAELFYGHQALILASQNGNFEVAKYLTDYGIINSDALKYASENVS